VRAVHPTCNRVCTWGLVSARKPGCERCECFTALAAGEKLNQAKAQMVHGEWLPWLKKNFDLSQVTASKYMRLAETKTTGSNFGSIREALAA
jgi:hypothetical protein